MQEMTTHRAETFILKNQILCHSENFDREKPIRKFLVL